MKGRSLVLFLLILGFGIMALLNGFLYTKNLSYKKENKGLIIQNDSILSANIELKQELERQRALTENKVVLRKKGSHKR